jgi:hypothetical protein
VEKHQATTPLQLPHSVYCAARVIGTEAKGCFHIALPLRATYRPANDLFAPHPAAGGTAAHRHGAAGSSMRATPNRMEHIARAARASSRILNLAFFLALAHFHISIIMEIWNQQPHSTA